MTINIALNLGNCTGLSRIVSILWTSSGLEWEHVLNYEFVQSKPENWTWNVITLARLLSSKEYLNLRMLIYFGQKKIESNPKAAKIGFFSDNLFYISALYTKFQQNTYVGNMFKNSNFIFAKCVFTNKVLKNTVIPLEDSIFLLLYKIPQKNRLISKL